MLAPALLGALGAAGSSLSAGEPRPQQQLQRVRQALKLPGASVVLGGAVAPAGGSEYVGYTMDYWNASQEKTQNWGPTASALAFNVSDDVLAKVASALAPASFRIGGSSADATDYDVPGGKTRCSPDLKRNCLTMPRWLAVLGWAKRVGARVTFTLNGLAGREGCYDRSWGPCNNTAPWDPTNAEEFLAYTKAHAPVGILHAVGLGNELTNGHCPAFPNCPPLVDPIAYARDVRTLRALVDRVWAGAAAGDRPLIAVPEAGFATNLNITLQLQYFDTFLQHCADAVDRVAYHMYIDGGDNPKLEADLLSATYLDEWDPKFPAALREIVRRRAPHAAAAGLWADETASAWGSCGGYSLSDSGHSRSSSSGNRVCDRFMDGYWYVHQLGTLARLGHSMFARQTLRGGWYELMNQTDNQPHPDFFVALMWKRVMGGKPLRVTSAALPHQGGEATECAGQLRAFASGGAGVSTAVALVNFCQTSSVSVAIQGAAAAGTAMRRHDYIFTPCSGDVHDNCVALGGRPLRTSSGGELPPLTPAAAADPSAPLVIPAGAYAWSVFS